MKRTPMKRKAPMRKKGESAADASWRDAREATLERDQWACQTPDFGGECRGGLHVHHRLPRSRGGTHHLSNLLTTCSWHHQYIHEHPAESYELGLLQRSGDTECVCGHISRLHAVSSGQCTWGPGLSYGHGCPCTQFEEAAA